VRQHHFPRFQTRQQPHPIRDSIAKVALQVSPATPQPPPARRRSHGVRSTRPIKIGAEIGCGAGATLGFLAFPYDNGPSVGEKVGGMAVLCGGFGLVGAYIGYLIASH
jgi:hypothetical protein